VVFTEDPHRYVLDGERELLGITTLLRKHGLSPDYTGIPQDVLEHAADLGSQAHKAIEAYCEGLPVTETPLIKSFKKLKLDIVTTEYLVTDFSTVASSIDLLAKVDEHTVDIIDMKRTSTVHKESVSWQCSIYAYLFETMNPDIKVRNLYCLPIKKGNTDDIAKDKCDALVELERISEWDVRTLIECESAGLKYEKPDKIDPVQDLAEVYINASYPTLASSLRQMKTLEKAIEEAKAGIRDFMTEHGVEKLVLGDVEIIAKRPYFSSRVDTKAMRKDHPDLVEKYTSQTEVSGSITIKLK